MNEIFYFVFAIGAMILLLWLRIRHKPYRVYIAGTVSGNKKDGIVDQDYRKRITNVMRYYYPELVVDDPLIGNENSIEYSTSKARTMFNGCLERITNKTNLLIAYIPEASMGTAIELYAAKQQDVYVVAITPLKSNWIVRLYADCVYDSLDCFEDSVKRGYLNTVIDSPFKTEVMHSADN